MKSLFRPFPLPLTRKQWFYILVLQGLGAGIIDFGANFAVAYAMYNKQKVVKMWIFSQNTIAGDLGVTPIIQCLASMIISSTLVHSDLHHSQIKPLPFVYPHVEHLPDPRSLFSKKTTDHNLKKLDLGSSEGVNHEKNGKNIKQPGATNPTRSSGLWHYFWMLIRFIFEGTEKNMLLARPGFKNWLGRLGWTAAQGAALGVVLGFPIWCLAILILGPIYKNDNMGDKWAPQIIKGVYGAIVGWITNPIIALLALGSQADHHLIVVEHVDEEATVGDGESGREIMNDGDGIVETIPENEELDVAGGGFDTSRRSSRFSPSTRPVSISSRRRSSIPSPLIHHHNNLHPPSSPLLQIPGHPVSPSPNRSRATSVSSIPIPARPPLTANVSLLSPLPSDLDPTFNLVHGSGSYLQSSNAAPQAPRSTFGRTRGATMSSIPSTTGYGYALGGCAGRANRSRSGSIISAKQSTSVAAAATASAIPAFVISATDGPRPISGFTGHVISDNHIQGRSRAGSWDVFGKRESTMSVAGQSSTAVGGFSTPNSQL